MTQEFDPISTGISHLISRWEPILEGLPEKLVTIRKNKRHRTIKQIVGHLIDSASNNMHRIIHLQYQPSPLHYPNYAIDGNNDKWIAIQNYQEEDWQNLIQLWKYSNLHLIHIINHVDIFKLENKWHYSEEKLISLKDIIIDYLRHLKLHLDEIDELIQA
jgi:hypothetical protein